MAFKMHCPKCAGLDYSIERDNRTFGAIAQAFELVFHCRCGKQLFGEVLLKEYERQKKDFETRGDVVDDPKATPDERGRRIEEGLRMRASTRMPSPEALLSDDDDPEAGAAARAAAADKRWRAQLSAGIGEDGDIDDGETPLPAPGRVSRARGTRSMATASRSQGSRIAPVKTVDVPPDVEADVSEEVVPVKAPPAPALAASKGARPSRAKAAAVGKPERAAPSAAPAKPVSAKAAGRAKVDRKAKAAPAAPARKSAAKATKATATSKAPAKATAKTPARKGGKAAVTAKAPASRSGKKAAPKTGSARSANGGSRSTKAAAALGRTSPARGAKTKASPGKGRSGPARPSPKKAAARSAPVKAKPAVARDDDRDEDGADGTCIWPGCGKKTRSNSKYCSRACSNKNARSRHKTRVRKTRAKKPARSESAHGRNA